MDYKNWMGQTVLDENGDEVGTIDQLYVDGDTEEPTWATVKSKTGLFGSKTNFVPVSLAEPTEDGIRFSTTAEAITTAPGIEEDGELNPAEQATLYRHYRKFRDGAGTADDEDDEDDGEVTAVDDDGDARGTVGHDVSGPTTDDAMTRSEEELNVGTRKEEAGRVRLRKYVVTENVQTTVPVSREEVRIEREPITDENVGRATSGPDLSDEEHEVVLNEEVPVIEKKTVPKERVRLNKETVTEERQVNEEVRKERIDVDGDGDRD